LGCIVALVAVLVATVVLALRFLGLGVVVMTHIEHRALKKPL
jgi:hypothetical protein